LQLSDLSVVIPTYNSLAYLKITVSCLEEQQPDPSLFEVIIVNDGSTDGTKLWLDNYSGVLNLKVVNLNSNKGRPAARNAGVDASTRSLLLFLDGDMQLPPDFLYGHCKSHNNPNCVTVGRVIYQRTLAYRPYANYLERRGVFKLAIGDPVPARYFLSGNSSLSREIWDTVGGFDEQLKEYGEDIDFGIRLANADGVLSYHPELVITHLHIRDISSMVRNSGQYGLKALPYLVGKHPQLLNELRLDFLQRLSIKGMVVRFLLLQPFYWLIYNLTRLLEKHFVPDLFFTYLTYRSYVNGYKKGIGL